MTTTIVALLAAGGLSLLVAGIPWFRRMRLDQRVDPYLHGLNGRPSALLQSGIARSRGGWASVVERWVSRKVPRPSRDLVERLASAGDMRAPEAFRLEQMVWGFSASVVSIAIVTALAVLGAHVDVRVTPVLFVLSAVTGGAARDWWLGRQIEARRVAIRRDLPTAIDLITLSIMAGDSIPAACARAADHLPGTTGYELARTVGEIRAGKSALDALEDMSLRVPDPAMGRLVDALSTALEQGAPLAETLRAQAEDVREARRRELLEAGGKREIVMLIPVVFLVLPVVVVFALLPGLVSLDLLVP